MPVFADRTLPPFPGISRRLMANSGAQGQDNRSIRRTTNQGTQVFTPYFASFVTDDCVPLCPEKNLMRYSEAITACRKSAIDTQVSALPASNVSLFDRGGRRSHRTWVGLCYTLLSVAKVNGTILASPEYSTYVTAG